MCKENGIHTAVDTAGNVPWDRFEKILQEVPGKIKRKN